MAGVALLTVLVTAPAALAAPPAVTELLPRCTPTGGPVVPPPRTPVAPAPAGPAARGLLPALLGAAVADVVGRAAPAPDPAPPPCTRVGDVPAGRPAPGGRAGDDTSAGVRQGWGAPSRVDDFDGTRLGHVWGVYDGPGHAGNGRRTPRAASVSGGVLTITGDARGNTAGMEWGSSGQRYGRWEGRVRAPASDESYDALLLLWPDAENFPVGGEIDFMEMMDHTRQTTNVFLHYGKRNRQVSGEVRVDATQWHDWAVEWTPTHVATFLDGRQWWRTDRAGILPPGPMHLCVQLDWFPDSGRGRVQPSTMQVDWVKQWTLAPAARAAADDAAEDVGPRVIGTPGSAVRAPSGPAW